MINFDKRWRQAAGFALGLPTAIFSISIFLQVAVEMGHLTKRVGNIILVIFITHCVVALVWYALRKKN